MSEKIVITDVGIAEVVNAEQSGTAPVTLSHIAFGTGKYTATKDMTALKSEFKRFDAISGGAIGDNVIHLEVKDYSADTYTVNEVGVFTESGTLFAVCSQTTPIVQKAPGSKAMLGFDFVFTDINTASVTVGDTNFALNPATTETAGTVELATETEAKAGTDTTRAITPATLDATIEAHDNIVHRSGSETITGVKTFTSHIKRKFDEIDRTEVAPEKNTYSGLHFFDKNNQEIGAARVFHSTVGIGVQFVALSHDGAKTNTLNIGYDPNGNAYTFVRTPASDSNDNNIATTAWVNNKASNYLPLAGGTLTGYLYLKSHIMGSSDTSHHIISGGTDYDKGGAIALYGKDEPDQPGKVRLWANNGNTSSDLSLYPDGQLILNNKHIVRSVNGNGADSAGNITAEQTGCLPLSGGKMTGGIYSASSNEYMLVTGGEDVNSGGYIRLDSKDHADTPGTVRLVANDGTNTKALRIDPDGTFTYEDNDIITAQGGVYKKSSAVSRDVDNSFVGIYGGTVPANGATVELCGKDHENYPGELRLYARNGESSVLLNGKPDGTLTWGGKNVVIDPGITALSETSGTVSLAVNKIYTIAVSDTTTFSLPTPADKTVFNQIKVMMKVTGTPTINWGTTNFFNKSTPEIEEGSYDIYFDYDNLLGAWVCGVMAKGAGE